MVSVNKGEAPQEFRAGTMKYLNSLDKTKLENKKQKMT